MLCTFKLILPFTNIHTYLEFDQRPCINIDMCEPKCPKYHLLEFIPQKNDRLKYEAKFHIEKVPFTPFGTLHSQELKLEVQNDSFGFGNKLNTIQIMADEFDDSGNNSSFIIGNLLKDHSYKPILKVYVSMDIKNETNGYNSSKVSAFIIKCEIEVNM